MKTFNDLEFHQHGQDGKAAILDFDNGYGVLVIDHGISFNRGKPSYIVTARVNNKLQWIPNVGDMTSWPQSSEGVTAVMERLQGYRSEADTL